jgi:flagellar export protein FliJ
MPFKYRLQALLDQKIEAKRDAQAAVGQALKDVEAAKQTLEELRNKEKALHEKKEHLRRDLFSVTAGQKLNANDLRNRSVHLKGMDYEIQQAGHEVFGQRIVVDECEDALLSARRVLTEAAKGVEILEKHKSKLEERFVREREHAEALEMDESGNAAFLRRQRDNAR